MGRIPTLDDLQAAWRFLQSCAAPRANYLLRILPPHITADYAAAYDASVARCLAALLEQGETLLPPTGVRAAHAPGPTLWRARAPLHSSRQQCRALGLVAGHAARYPDASACSRRTTPSSLARRRCSPLYGRRGRLREAGYGPGWDAQGASPLAPDLQRPGEDSGPWPFKGWERPAAEPAFVRAFETHLSEQKKFFHVSCVAAHANRPFRRPSYQCPTHPPMSRHDPQRQLPRAPTAAPAHAPAARAAQMRVPWAAYPSERSSCGLLHLRGTVDASAVKPVHGSPATSGWPT